MKIRYKEIRFSKDTLEQILMADKIIREYAKEGFTLTLRQLYYQFVSRDLIPNTFREYRKLGNSINDGRIAGLIDWDMIEDRTRGIESVSHWDNPSSIIRSAASSFRIDKWENQPYRVEVWIEKDALTGVIEGVCRENDIGYLSCRGYSSQSEMWRASIRFREWIVAGQRVVILHFGDHDPSGIDMTRDIRDRLEFLGVDSSRIEVRRIALTIDQVRKYHCPPNFAKSSDSRFKGYENNHGNQSWELDALEPNVIVDLVRNNIQEFRKNDLYIRKLNGEKKDRKTLQLAADNWPEVVSLLERYR